MPVYVNQPLRKDLNLVSNALLSAINEAKEKFKALSESDWSFKKSPANWSKKEVLGHLLDSAANNHIRFVRAQLMEKEFVGLGYEQDFFVKLNHYQERSAGELIELWAVYNRHIAHVIKHVDASKLDIICKIGDSEPVTLLFVIEDYIEHIKHHLKQIIG